MKKIIFIFILFAFSSILYSQNIFNIVYDDTITNIVSDVVITNEDKTPYVVVNPRSVNLHSTQYFTIVGIDESGEKIWEKPKFYDSQVQVQIAYNALKRIRNGYLYYAKPDWTWMGNGKFSLLLMDSSFNTTHIKDTLDFCCFVGDIQEYTNGDLFYCGQILDSTISDNVIANCAKTDSLGNVIWNKLICNTNLWSCNFKLTFTSDGDILLGGLYNYEYSEGKWMLTKIDTAGNIRWQRNFGHSRHDNGKISGLLELPDGNYLVSGYYPTIDIGCGDYLTDGCLRKISYNGNDMQRIRLRSYNWHTSQSSETIYIDNEVSSILFSDGYIYAIGGERILNLRNAYLIKMDLNGNILWKRAYQGRNDYNAGEYLMTFARAKDGGFIMGGRGYYPLERAWLVKTDSLGLDGLTNTELPELDVDIEFPETLRCGDSTSCMLQLTGASAPYTLRFSTGQTIDSIYYPPVWMPYEVELGEILIGSVYRPEGGLTETEANYVDENYMDHIHKPIQFVAPNRIGLQEVTITVSDFYGKTKTITKVIDVVGNDCGSAIESVEEQQVRVYPNPANENFIVDGENIIGIEICNLLGISVFEMQSCSNHNIISTETIPSGSYFVKVKMTDGKVVVEKIEVVK